MQFKLTMFLIFVLTLPLSVSARAYLDTQSNQIILNDRKITLVTTRGNVSPTSSESECLAFLAWKANKTCISYQVLVPNYNNEFGIFIKTELWAQELIGKTVFKYDFASKKIVNVQHLLPADLKNSPNFWMWYASAKIGYTTWNSPSYSKPTSFDPSIFR